MKIVNIDFAECIGLVDTHTRWFKELYKDTDWTECEYVTVNKGCLLADALLDDLADSFPEEEIVLTWYGKYDADLADYSPNKNETWFVRFKSDDTD